jgi:4'-phosphopantetheinyl transferase
MTSLFPTLPDGEVHVWKIDLCENKWDASTRVLSRCEYEKANKFHSLDARNRYRRCHIAVRVLLSLYSGQPPEKIRFGAERFGKPRIVGSASLNFNLSHSADVALLAVTSRPVGIDIELASRKIDFTELAYLVCHPTERTPLDILPYLEGLMYFYRLWTRKESYCKAIGAGLHHPIAALHFEMIGSGQGWRVCRGGIPACPAFYVYDLVHIPGYVASLALARQEARIKLLDAAAELLTPSTMPCS